MGVFHAVRNAVSLQRPRRARHRIRHPRRDRRRHRCLPGLRRRPRSRRFPGDANDHLYQWDSSRDYNPSPGLERIQATLLAINSTDDERNPPELGLLDREIKRVKNGRVFLIPGSQETSGHGTTGQAKFWKKELAELLQSAPRRAQ